MKKIPSYLLFWFGLLLYSQNEGAYLYFNNFGGVFIDGCTQEEVPVYDGQAWANTNNVLVGVSNSSISDKNGDLLFYSNGLSIFDRNHNPLPNADEDLGTALEGKGNSLILPQPGSDHLYYIFTLDNGAWWNSSGNGALSGLDDGINHGLEYSVIDLNLNDGFGDVIQNQKRIHLITYDENDATEVDFRCSKKLTAVRSPDCSSYWIITHFIDRFYAFKFDENGVDPNPVVSSQSPQVPISALAFGSSIIPVSSLKVSTDGTKLAMTYGNLDASESNSASPKGLYLYDLNAETGEVSNSLNLTIPPELIGFDLLDYFAISVEFSLDGRYLYAATQRDDRSDFQPKPRIWRWNMESEQINNTVELVYETEAFLGAGALQLARNGNILHVRERKGVLTDFNNHLGIFENVSAPNIEDIIYDELAIQLNQGMDTTRVAINSLPQINPQWFGEIINISNNTVNPCQAFICGDSSSSLTAPFDEDAIYQWYFNDELLVDSTGHILEVFEEGAYRVEVSFNSSSCRMLGYTEVIQTTTAPEVIDATAFQCGSTENNDGIAQFRLNNYLDLIVPDPTDVNVKFFESFADAQDQINELDADNFTNTSNPQIVYAVVNNAEDACFSIAELELVVSPNSDSNRVSLRNCNDGDAESGFASFNLDSASSDLLAGLPEDYRVSFHLTLEDAQLQEAALSSPYTNEEESSQIVYARINDQNACLDILEVELVVDSPPDVELEETLFYCQDRFPEPIILDSGLPDSLLPQYEYNWSNGATTSRISVNEPGTYTVQISNGSNCSLERVITVVSSSKPVIEDLEISELSSQNSIRAIMAGAGDYEYSISGNDAFQDSPLFEDLPPGIYNLRVRDKNGCGVIEELVSVSGFPKFFSPNGDGVNDTWQVKNLTSRIVFDGDILIFDRYGKFITRILPGSQGWNGFYQGNIMPNSDYWFKVKLSNGETLTGHFALRR